MHRLINDPPSHIGSRILALRKKCALTASALAKASHVTPAAVWFWEHQGVIPREETIEFIASALGVTREFLLNGQAGLENPNAAPEPTASHGAVTDASLEDLIRAIESKGFAVSITSKLLSAQE